MTLWNRCIRDLQAEIPEQQFNTWIRPLQAVEDGEKLRLLAPNRFVVDWLNEHYIERILEIVDDSGARAEVVIEVGSRQAAPQAAAGTTPRPAASEAAVTTVESRLNPSFTFDAFVEGKSNQLARAAALQVGENPGKSYNPLFIYGGVGLGKTHLMQAIGNAMLSSDNSARVAYIHSERFVRDMVHGLQHNRIEEFQRTYRSLDALLIDDIQFFAGKERSQEEFFHTFNALLEGQRQIVLTCDRYPKEVAGLEERLKSRFGWGLTVAISARHRDSPIHRAADQPGIRQGGPAGPAGVTGPAGVHREYPEDRRRLLQDSPGRFALEAAQSLHCAAEASRHGAGQRADKSQPAGDR
jgi:chromosomal replication initiator protein